ncbi:MAG: hypothetical protein HY912_05245 [Desulfomonile tiedjei]|uniref:PrcB C-terminal domain-containing protein n=1 Tax=Desulfomonile tiedjei TaxID=2358 RepID=A0A9D6Z2L3_9BACT|nr:hypothetical protein [Desulfomonile tiedjei]
MIARLVMLCCALVPLLCLAVAPERQQYDSAANLRFAPGQDISQFVELSDLTARFATDAGSGASDAGLGGVLARLEKPKSVGALYSGIDAETNGFEVCIALKPAAAGSGNAAFAGGQAPDRPVIVILSVPPNVAGELSITYKAHSEQIQGVKPMAVPAATIHPVLPK